MKNFSWQAPEYVHTEKTQDWYWTVGIIATALAVTSVIFGNVLFAIVIAVGTFTLTLFSARKPHTMHVEITEKAVHVDNMTYSFKSLESFGIDDEHLHGPKLHLKPKKHFSLHITLPVHPDDADDIRAHLLGHLKEEAFEQSPFHKIFDRLGF